MSFNVLKIKKLREYYNLSQREFGKILGFGKMTVNRYENGYYPTLSHRNYLYAFIVYPDLLYEFASIAYIEGRISRKTLDKFIERCD